VINGDMIRRRFLEQMLLAGAMLPTLGKTNSRGEQNPVGSADLRASWVAMLEKVATPVIANLAANQLKARMPVELPRGPETRRAVTHLEALGRTLAGLAPWLGVSGADDAEENKRTQMAALTRQAIANAVDPAAADHLDFTVAPQNVVDSALLALGLSRARAELWDKLDEATRKRIIAALQSTRKHQITWRNNWLLFSAMIETFLATVGAEWRAEPIDVAIKAHQEWYKGDGAYGDGSDFHWDYYNSFVIHPMLVTILELIGPIDDRWDGVRKAVHERALRYAAVQERLIAPDGSYPAFGRSITYRCGAFHHLAMMALRHELPKGLTPSQVRSALDAVIKRTLGTPNTFDSEGWLRVGLSGHQPSLAERYISTGSLYLCTLTFLPLGLSPADEFWTAPAMAWSSCQLWSGMDRPADHAI
jgi:hypothetical protein